MLHVLLCVAIAGLVVPALGEVPLLVNTTKGLVQGQRAADGDYTTFFGIPYAKVDLENPFGSAIDQPPFETTFVASDRSIKCAQANMEGVSGVLDCLVLNVYVPQDANVTNVLPVLVWFHGGLFAFGSGGEFGGQYFVNHDIILVTVNYRLGPYGFLCLNHRDVPGNQGLKDQVAALKWVKENIANFGGNADEVTISGESAGAGSVDLHLYSKYASETLFNKVIIQSGSSFVEGMFVKADHDAAWKLASEIGYQSSRPPSVQDQLRFLTSAGPEKVLDAFSKIGLGNLEMRPCKEGRFKGVKNFIKDDPFHLHSPRMSKVKILAGYNSKEEFGFMASEPEEYFTNLGPFFYDKLKKNYKFSEVELQKVAHIVRKYYLGSKAISKDALLELVDFGSDFVMNRAAELSVNKYLNQGAESIYKYLFSYIGGSPYANYTGAGASHAEELRYLFQLDDEPLLSKEDILIKDRMTTMWANFVKYGDPTPNTTELIFVKWNPVTSDSPSRPYLNIDSSMEMGEDLYKERIAFWELFFHAYWRKSVLV